MQTRARNLVNEGFAAFPLETEAYVKRVIGGFQKLLKEPEDVRATWQIDLSNGDGQGPDDGLIFRSGGTNEAGEQYDEKYFLHDKGALEFLLHLHDARRWANHKKFLRRIAKLRQLLVDEGLAIAREIDGAFPEIDLYKKMSTPGALALNSFRLLWYCKTRNQDEGFLGKPHHDRCLMTLHVADSRPGLYLGLDEPKPYNVEPNHVAAFWGRKGPYVDPRFRSMPHEIRQVKRKSSEPEWRWAIVMFLHNEGPMVEVPAYRTPLSAVGSQDFTLAQIA